MQSFEILSDEEFDELSDQKVKDDDITFTLE